jgi:hypothetical protein
MLQKLAAGEKTDGAGEHYIVDHSSNFFFFSWVFPKGCMP